MAFLRAFSVGDFVDTLISLLAAFVLGTLIGAERQYRRRGGGLRTHTLVAVGAATFVDIGMHLNGNAGATQVIAYVVSGVGFLGAGVILHDGDVHRVKGLTTAACVWMTACIGMICGTGNWKILFVTVGFIALLLIVGGPIERALHKRWGRKHSDPPPPGP